MKYVFRSIVRIIQWCYNKHSQQEKPCLITGGINEKEILLYRYSFDL